MEKGTCISTETIFEKDDEMRTRKYIPKKGMALMLALLMCISASQMAAFTGAKGGGVSVTTTVTDVSGNPPAIPEDAAVSTETTQSTDTSTGESTKTVITDTTWGSTEEKTGDYVPEPTATPSSTQQDGQVITTETQVENKTDVKTEVEGQQHREDTEVTNQNGAKLEDGFTLEGSQTTTTTVIHTQKTTETETRTDLTAEEIPGEESEAENVGEARTETSKSEVSSTPTASGSTGTGTAAAVGEQPEVTVTVSEENPNDSQTVLPQSLDAPTAAALAGLLQDLAGWELVIEDGSIIGTVLANGTVIDNDGKVVNSLQFIKSDDGSIRLELSLQTAKRSGEISTTPGTSETTKGDVTTVEGTPTDWTEGERVSTGSSAEGNVTTEEFQRTDTASRTDTNTWTETTTQTDQKQQQTESYAKTIRVVLDNSGRTVVGVWKGSSDNSTTTPDETIQPYEKYLSNGSNRANRFLNGKHLCNDGSNPVHTLKGQFTYTGYGVCSTVLVKLDGKYDYNYSAHQFELTEKDGTKHYVYCADMETDAHLGSGYTMTNIEDANYYQGENAIDHIKAIAMNGYWGTLNNEGSLEAIQQLLRDYKAKNDPSLDKVNSLTEEEIQALDEGFSLSATQAALWKFGNCDGDVWVADSLFEKCGTCHGLGSNTLFHNCRESISGNAALETQRKAAQALYQLLVSDRLMNDNKAQLTDTDMIGLDDISSASITVKERIDLNAADQAVKNTAENDVYNTDVSFNLAVVPGEDDSLIVRIYNGDDVVATRRLAGEDTEGYGLISPDSKGNYTIPDIQLAENVNITLKLEGTQLLQPGVYLYQSAGSQTFVGVSTGEARRNLDLEVKLSFEVEDATQRTEANSSKYTTTENWSETTVTEQDKRSETQVDLQRNSTIKVTTTVTEKKSIHVDKLVWKDGQSNKYSLIADPAFDKTASPVTGDSSLIWGLLAGFSAFGLLCAAAVIRKKCS